MKRYGTIKRGNIKFKIGGKQHKLLEARTLPYSIVTIKNKKKKYKRYNVGD